MSNIPMLGGNDYNLGAQLGLREHGKYLTDKYFFQ